MSRLVRGEPIRVLVVCDTVGATQHISFSRPLAADIEAGTVILTMVGHDPAWADEAVCRALWSSYEPDVLILSRYTSGLADGIISAARDARRPVIFHIDDDLLNVPESLGQSKFEHYNQPERLAALRRAMDASDFVYASTLCLAQALADNAIIVPQVHGDIYCSVDTDAVIRPLPATGPVIGYMATGGHGADMDMVLPAVERLMNEVPELRFETFGTIGAAERLNYFGSRISHHKGVPDYDRFLAALGDLGWWVGIAPLEDTPFNRCKADTKWVEYTFAGLATVASNLPVYQQACADGAGLLASSEAEWYAALRRLILDRHFRQDTVANGRRKLMERYSRNALRAQLLDVLARAGVERSSFSRAAGTGTPR